jgi:glycosyltransferase involved in cell wall biosynthesis
MDRMLIITPHLSTGGLPQFLLKKIKVLLKKWNIYLIECDDITGGRLVVQKNELKNLLGSKLITLNSDKNEILSLISSIKPKVIHFEEFPETFISNGLLDSIFFDLKNSLDFYITDTTHGTGFNKRDKKFISDKTMFVSNINWSQYAEITNVSEVIEFEIDSKIYRENNLIELGLNPNQKHIMNVGLFNSNKNQSEIFEYAQKMENDEVMFHFFGNMADNFIDYWKPLTENTPKNCKIWGERSDLHRFYRCMDLFLFTSKLENRPLSVLEATSYDMPVLMYNLKTYGRDFSNFKNVNFLTNDINSNLYLIRNKLNIQKNKNKSEISAYHILTDVDSESEVQSQISLTKLEKFGINYKALVNKRWTTLPPSETCEYPDKISMETGGELTPVHYNCYLAHKDAFYRGFNDNSEFILIFECDAIIDVETKEFVNKIKLACDILNKTDLLMFSFGFHNGVHIIDKNSTYWTVNRFYGSHAYLIPKKSFGIIDKMYRESKWNATDLLFSEKLNQYKIGIFENPPIKQASGWSILDKVYNEERY